MSPDMRRLALATLFLLAATGTAGLVVAVDGLVPDHPAPVRPIELVEPSTTTTVGAPVTLAPTPITTPAVPATTPAQPGPAPVAPAPDPAPPVAPAPVPPAPADDDGPDPETNDDGADAD